MKQATATILFAIMLAVSGCQGIGRAAGGSPPTATQAATTIPAATTTPPTAAFVTTPAAGPVATPTQASATFKPRVEVVASGLQVPWALAFADQLPGENGQAQTGSFILLTERPGRVRLISDGRLLAEPVATLPVAATGEAGLMGLALDPQFASNGYLYVMYTYRDGGALKNRISRLTLRGERASQEKVLLDNLPGGSIHDGGRLAFGPDGKLYAGAGDAGSSDLAQNRESLGGKILRLNADGSVPADNPFPGSPVYSYGHRNPEGLAWHPQTQQLYATEHGSSARDEVNRVEARQNYGWPTVRGKAGDSRFRDPVHESGDETWAPAGAAFYDGTLLAPWQGSLFFGALRGQHLHRLVVEGDRVVAEERLFDREYGRIRAVSVGPEGALYFSTSNRDGRGSPAVEDDRILRIVGGE